LTLLDKHLLFSTFGVSSFNELELYTQSMAPSMVEYYINDVASSSDIDNSHLSNSNIQQTIFFNSFSLYIDYNNEVYLEFKNSVSSFRETGTLW
jgi:hypothetical protein